MAISSYLRTDIGDLTKAEERLPRRHRVRVFSMSAHLFGLFLLHVSFSRAFGRISVSMDGLKKPCPRNPKLSAAR